MMRKSLLATIAIVLCHPSVSWACSVCFGDPNSSMALGMNNAILTLLGVVFVVQGLFVALFIAVWKRGKRLREKREAFHLLDGGVRS